MNAFLTLKLTLTTALAMLSVTRPIESTLPTFTPEIRTSSLARSPASCLK